MTASNGRRSSVDAEAKLESGALSPPTPKPDQQSAGLHPAFYIALGSLIAPRHEDDTDARAGSGSRAVRASSSSTNGFFQPHISVSVTSSYLLWVYVLTALSFSIP